MASLAPDSELDVRPSIGKEKSTLRGKLTALDIYGYRKNS
ncbi:hypothetical protein EV05_0902 [Prochlorococcus sp. MIT 0601]|nr:hypothetical protein EV05_0902 [Prochlorococcus sp. MIT 0601]